VQPLSERERPVARHFSKSRVQYIGSTSHCGCDFPHVIFQSGGWPWFDDGEVDDKREDSERFNREGLVALLRQIEEPTVELYGVWDGDYDAPAIREEIYLGAILERDFRFKEKGFYTVTLRRGEPMRKGTRREEK